MSTNVYNTLNQLQSNTNKVNFELGRQNLGSDKLDKTAFMRLMMAQLQYQDPTEPTDNSQFLQQQAMYAQTEAVQNLSDTMNLTSQISQATSMVGKFVEVGYMEEGKTDPTFKTGKVDSVVINNGKVGLRIGELIYDLNQVTKVFAEEPTTGTGGNNTPSLPDQIVAANKLNGKYVTFNLKSDTGTTPVTYSGVVSEVVSETNKVSLKIGGQLYNYADIAVKSSADSPPTS